MSNLTSAGLKRTGFSIAIPMFATTLFLSAGLMFFVEPMVAKMVLPKLGGAPAVWSTCLVFFQAMLLLGYAYAHLLTRLSRLAQVILHVCVLLPLAAAVLPLSLGMDVPSLRNHRFYGSWRASPWPAEFPCSLFRRGLHSFSTGF
ncbi:hypothetical protein [Bradyrhizobium sp. USDA 4454]